MGVRESELTDEVSDSLRLFKLPFEDSCKSSNPKIKLSVKNLKRVKV